jgi:prophage regulatory protein
MGTAGRNGKGLRMSPEWESGAKHLFPLPFPFLFPLRRTANPMSRPRARTPQPEPGTAAERQLAMEAMNLAQFALARATEAVEDAMRRLRAAEAEKGTEVLQPVALPAQQELRSAMDPEQLLVLKEVKAIVALSHNTIYQMMAKGQFPSARRIGPNSVRWRWRDIEAWLAGLDPAR